MQETPRPQERASKARGTECGNLDGPLLIFGPAMSDILLIVVITERRRR